MTWKILVIDDDEKLNRLLKRFLGEFDFTVYTASDAAEGLIKVRTVSPDLTPALQKILDFYFSCELNPPPLVEDPERFYRSGEK